MSSAPGNASTTIASCWQAFLERLEGELGKDTVDRWARSLVVKAGNGPKLTLEAKDSFQALWFEEHLRPRLSSLVDPLGAPIHVTLQIAGRSAPGKSANRSVARPSKFDPSQFSLTFPEVDPTCTFERFLTLNEIVIKLFNELCSYLAGERLKSSLLLSSPVETPNASHPPTHCTYAALLDPERHTSSRRQYVSNRPVFLVIMAKSDLFTEHVVRSIRAGEMATFRKLWRNVDALLLDDVHCLARKSTTQEEFFHTFNSLHIAGKADHPLRQLPAATAAIHRATSRQPF